MALVFPLRKNSCDAVMKCFQTILSICGKKPERLNSDRGSELICKKFETFLSEKKNISLSVLKLKEVSYNRKILSNHSKLII